MPPVRHHYEPNQPDLWPNAIPDHYPDGRSTPYYPREEFGDLYPQPSRPFPYQQHFPVRTPVGPHITEHKDFNPLFDDHTPLLPQNNPAVPDVWEQINPDYHNPQWHGPYTRGPGFPEDKHGRPPWLGGNLPGPEHPGWDQHSPWGSGGVRFGQERPWATGKDPQHTPKNPEPGNWPIGLNTEPGRPRKSLPNNDPLAGALLGGNR